MKNFNKTALAAALLMGVSPLSVLAANEVTINNATKDATYNAYQLFTGTFTTKAEGTPAVNVPNIAVPGDLVTGAESAAAADAGTNQMGDIQFGSAAGADGATLVNAINEYMTGKSGWSNIGKKPGESLAYTTAKAIADNADLHTTDFSNFLAGKLAAAGATPTATKTVAEGATSVSLDVDTSGYYLINNTVPENGSQVAYTSAIMMPVAPGTPLTINNKATTPTLDKTIKTVGDENYTKGAASAIVGKAAMAAGATNNTALADLQLEQTTYKLDGSVPHNIADYGAYVYNFHYNFHDQLPAGVTLGYGTGATTVDPIKELSTWNLSVTLTGVNTAGTDVTVKLPMAMQGTVLTTGNSVNNATAAGAFYIKGADITAATETAGAAFVVRNTDLKAALETAGIDYTYKNADKVKVSLTYTPVYNETTLTNLYENATKIENPQTNQAFLEFSNDPYGSQDGEGETPTTDTKLYSFSLKVNKVQPNGEATQALTGAKFILKDASGKAVGNEVEVAADGTFTFVGLGDKTEYTLEEVQVPAGFKRIDPIKFVINPTFGADGTLTATTVNVTSDPSGAASGTEGENGSKTLNITANAIETDVLNVPGPNMPLTGENQMMIGMIAGGMIIAVSAVVYSRRKHNEATAA